MAKKKSNKKKANVGAATNGNGDGIMVDPARVRFQHARIRPFFSGCGRGVEDTLEEIRQGKTQLSDLPPIQVLMGPIEEETGQPWYFSLNNRRLWVLKRCREEGLLPNNQIYARVRKPKSEQEARRYTVENCALEAKIMSEKPRGEAKGGSAKTEILEETNEVEDLVHNADKELSISSAADNEALEAVDDSEDSESSEEEPTGPANRFSALF
jgi:hypothetical protein